LAEIYYAIAITLLTLADFHTFIFDIASRRSLLFSLRQPMITPRFRQISR